METAIRAHANDHVVPNVLLTLVSEDHLKAVPERTHHVLHLMTDSRACALSEQHAAQAFLCVHARLKLARAHPTGWNSPGLFWPVRPFRLKGAGIGRLHPDQRGGEAKIALDTCDARKR